VQQLEIAPGIFYDIDLELAAAQPQEIIGIVAPRHKNQYRTSIPIRTLKNMRIDAIAVGNNPPEDVNVIIEVPVGGQPIKYELDKDSGALFVDRFLYTPMTYPGNYGFVPHTLSDDGDPIDVLICNTRALMPTSVINVRPIGVLVMEDNKGQDEKIIAVPSPHLTLRYEKVHNYTDLPDITLKQIQHFFEHYKDLEPGKWVKIGDWGDEDAARQLITEAIERHNAKKA
jgi:inorganic pyrophosphatase